LLQELFRGKLSRLLPAGGGRNQVETQPTFWLSPTTCSEPGPGIRSLAEPILDTTSDFAEIIFAILGVAAKLESRCILERTARGRADARANSIKFGRKTIPTPHQQKQARARISAGET
jgi:DNA invertase Pin-like site-specific DNA recombinase